jgi:3-hydroxyisobutyrate dehydrogenase-like beta-hydroxyacid dehydrogenase
METIGFIGLGIMGKPMALNLIKAGHSLVVHSRSRKPVDELVSAGATAAATPADVAKAASVVITMVPDTPDVELVLTGPDGVVDQLKAGTIVIDMSTISPEVTKRLAATIAAKGGSMLDAPVSGGEIGAKNGTLTIMVGGDEDAYRLVEPILRELGSPTRIGDNGQGLALKLAINISLAVQTLAFSEGLLLAARDGVDPQLAAEVMAGSPIGSPMLKARVPLVLDLPDDAWFDVGLMHKDIRLALAMGDELGLQLPSAHAADEELTEAENLGYGHRDIASAYDVLATMAAS